MRKVLKYLPGAIILLLLYPIQDKTNLAILNTRQDSVHASFCEKHADSLSMNYDYSGAAKYYEKAAELFLKIDFNLLAIKNFNKAGKFYCNNSQFLKSEKSLLIAQNILSDNYINNNKYLYEEKELYSNLGILYLFTEDYEKAEEFLHKGLKNVEELISLGLKPHSEMIECHNNLSALYICVGQNEKFLKYNDLAYNLCLKIYGENSYEAGEIFLKKAIFYDEQGDYLNSLNIHKKALSIFIESGYSESYLASACYYNIGRIYLDLNKDEIALNYYKKALEIAKLYYKDNHPDIIKKNNIIATIYLDQDYSKQSLSFFKKNLKSSINIFGPNSLEVGMIYDNYGSIYLINNDINNALINFQKGLEIRKKKLEKKKSFIISQSYFNIGYCYFLQGDLQKAFNFYQNSLIALIPSFDETSTDINPEILAYNGTFNLKDEYK
ncbi:tetratricopeptide repeat protein, partial [Bacteroidota bacterium]